MKIVAGIGAIDEYEAYVKAGADELFCGYVPESWALQQGTSSALNRREVFYYNVQIGSESELQILHSMIEQYKVPVTIAFNSLSYTPKQYPQIAKILEACMENGFFSFIIADLALLVYLQQKNYPGIQLHVSGELGEVNHYMVEEMRDLGAKRIIFHRKNTLEDMKKMIQIEQEMHRMEPLEYEAFAMNEMCHFNGSYCNSLHCDELPHMCHVPYRLGQVDARDTKSENERKGSVAGDFAVRQTEVVGVAEDECDYIPGMTGCGLCALWKLRDAGVTHLKLVSRGNYIDDTIEDIKALRRVLDILEDSASEVEYMEQMKKEIFNYKCSNNCYYR